MMRKNTFIFGLFLFSSLHDFVICDDRDFVIPDDRSIADKPRYAAKRYSHRQKKEVGAFCKSDYECVNNVCRDNICGGRDFLPELRKKDTTDENGPSNPKGVTVIHPKHPWAKNGKYFNFTKKVWVDEIGAYGMKDVKFFVNQWRDAKLIWSGVVTVWYNGNGNIGRREPYGAAKANQWKAGDVITKVKGVTVIHTKHPWAESGRYFYFTKKVWVDEIGAYGKEGKFFVNQWRDAKLIWSGVVIVWDNGYYAPHGRREPYGAAKANQWKAGDVITKKADVTVLMLNE